MSEHKKCFQLSFGIGPVQSFVSQSRRTRDLWCGSWLLSYLAETALAYAENQGGESVIPFREDTERGKVTAVESSIGGVPNRFVVEFESESAAVEAAEGSVLALQTAWRELASHVWNNCLVNAAELGNQTNEIWHRQIENFWECSWVVGVPEGEFNSVGSLSHARKQLRNVKAVAEPGIKCSLISSLQELSGHLSKAAQDNFWEAVRKKTGRFSLSSSERLSAVALVKRMLPQFSESAVGVDLGAASWPSTSMVAATPWLLEVDSVAKDEAERFVHQARDLGFDKSEQATANKINVPWAGIDSHVWFKSSLERNEWGVEPADLKTVLSGLKNVCEVAKSQEPIPYYAMLVMDGDSMGDLLARLDSPAELSRCLKKFTNSVDSIISDSPRFGRTVYAGGDDVMAMLPAEHAVDAAWNLSQHYRSCFAGTAAAGKATISGAIVFAHHQYPLRKVLHTAHELLDDVAKDATGRDALAIGIIQSSGLNACWSTPWAMFEKDSAEFQHRRTLTELVPQFGKEDSSSEMPNFNASFLYHLRTQYSKLFAKSLELPGSHGRLSKGMAESEGLLANLANSEYRRRMSSDAKKKYTPEQTLEMISPLIGLSHLTKNDNGKVQVDKSSFGFDGWRVARFLAAVAEGKVGERD